MRGRIATALVYLGVASALSGCVITTTRPDQENYVLDTSRIPVERFLDALSNRLSGSLKVTKGNLPNEDPNETYWFKAGDAMVVLSAMPHDRCNPNGPWHTTFDPAYQLDFVYRTSDLAKREAAKQKLFQAASDVGAQLTKFEECPHSTIVRSDPSRMTNGVMSAFDPKQTLAARMPAQTIGSK